MTPEEQLEIERRLTTLEADVRHAQRTLDEVRNDLKSVLVAIDQARGGWRVIAFQLGIAGLLGTLVGWLLKGVG